MRDWKNKPLKAFRCQWPGCAEVVFSKGRRQFCDEHGSIKKRSKNREGVSDDCAMMTIGILRNESFICEKCGRESRHPNKWRDRPYCLECYRHMNDNEIKHETRMWDSKGVS
jgi:hypothetical protein